MNPVEVETVSSITVLSQSDWDACAGSESGAPANNPFVTWRFLHALEASGSVGPGTGWQPHCLVARQNGKMIGGAPLFVKSHSQGEYVFDHAWADAWERAGGRYYPKLQIAAPFTPVTGPRLLARPGYEDVARPALISALAQIGERNQLSSAHVTFCTKPEAELAAEMGFLTREGVQFHWYNDGYGDFDQFLGALSSRKRKAIRRERAKAQGFGGEIVQLRGADLCMEHWDAFWQFYQDTGARKWGTPYLTRSFFDYVQQDMRDDVLLVLALRDGAPIAGALNFIGSEALYGRYWGCIEHHDAMHFELCYYQAIDFAITHGLKRVEAGAQGEHKLARGYLPAKTYSAHWIGHEGFRHAVAEFVEAEARAIDHEAEILTSYGPFKTKQMEEQQ